MKTKFFPVIMFAFLFLGMTSLFAGCHYIGGIKGDGKVIKETRSVPSFNGIDISGAFDVYLKQGSTEEVILEADDNILPLIRTDVVGGTLRIEIHKPIHHATVLKAYITVKELKNIEVSGAVDLETTSRITVPELSVDASGASDSKMDIAVQKLKLDCSGASKFKFSGTAVDVGMDLSGASDIFAYDLFAENYDLQISGAGNAQVNVSKKIRAEISGAGSVRYKGSPSEVDQSVSGAGSIRKSE
ncbi:MAG: DUF2807 domain-containing protein [Bacteroidales bacterium]|jgi:hypothetical protein|nr:DUF2807 domain-containing protein [Bacteroidales bacterium]